MRSKFMTNIGVCRTAFEPYVGDSTAFLLDAAEADQRILYEGAQGALLDIDHGTFPFVTSSNSSGVGVSAGAGVPGRWIQKVLGVMKSYSTRVGGGPFPTEQDNEVGQQIREWGREYGTTTGRPRRCGWLDAVAVRYTARLSGVDSLSVMMMDVLSHLPEIKICVAYELEWQTDGTVPESCRRFAATGSRLRDTAGLAAGRFPGSQSGRSFPAGARRYLDRVAELVGRPVEVVSVGPDRKQTIFAEDSALRPAVLAAN
jgi:adenylosuccinate synthase